MTAERMDLDSCYVESTAIQNAAWQSSASMFSRNCEKNALAKTLLFSLVKNDNDIFSNMQLNELYRHHCKTEAQSISVPSASTNT